MLKNSITAVDNVTSHRQQARIIIVEGKGCSGKGKLGGGGSPILFF